MQDLYERLDNKRRSCFLTYQGRRRSLNAWARITGINRQTLQSRLERGMTVEMAFYKGTRYHLKRKHGEVARSLAHRRSVVTVRKLPKLDGDAT